MKDWFLQRKLEKIGKHADPDAAFVRSLERELRARTAPIPRRSLGWKMAVSSLTSFALLFGGTGTYAYTSDAVLPDHPLYPVRETIEDFEEATAVTDSWKATVKIRHLKRRVHEQVLIEEKQKPFTRHQMQRFVGKLEQTIDVANHLPEPVQENVDRTAAKLEREYAVGLLQARERVQEEPVREKIDQILHEQTERLKGRVEKLEEKRREHFKVIEQRHEVLRKRQELRAKLKEDLHIETTVTSSTLQREQFRLRESLR